MISSFVCRKRKKKRKKQPINQKKKTHTKKPQVLCKWWCSLNRFSLKWTICGLLIWEISPLSRRASTDQISFTELREFSSLGFVLKQTTCWKKQMSMQWGLKMNPLNTRAELGCPNQKWKSNCKQLDLIWPLPCKNSRRENGLFQMRFRKRWEVSVVMQKI